MSYRFLRKTVDWFRSMNKKRGFSERRSEGSDCGTPYSAKAKETLRFVLEANPLVGVEVHPEIDQAILSLASNFSHAGDFGPLATDKRVVLSTIGRVEAALDNSHELDQGQRNLPFGLGELSEIVQCMCRQDQSLYPKAFFDPARRDLKAWPNHQNLFWEGNPAGLSHSLYLRVNDLSLRIWFRDMCLIGRRGELMSIMEIMDALVIPWAPEFAVDPATVEEIDQTILQVPATGSGSDFLKERAIASQPPTVQWLETTLDSRCTELQCFYLQMSYSIRVDDLASLDNALRYLYGHLENWLEASKKAAHIVEFHFTTPDWMRYLIIGRLNALLSKVCPGQIYFGNLLAMVHLPESKTGPCYYTSFGDTDLTLIDRLLAQSFHFQAVPVRPGFQSTAQLHDSGGESRAPGVAIDRAGWFVTVEVKGKTSLEDEGRAIHRLLSERLARERETGKNLHLHFVAPLAMASDIVWLCHQLINHPLGDVENFCRLTVTLRIVDPETNQSSHYQTVHNSVVDRLRHFESSLFFTGVLTGFSSVVVEDYPARPPYPSTDQAAHVVKASVNLPTKESLEREMPVLYQKMRECLLNRPHPCWDLHFLFVTSGRVFSDDIIRLCRHFINQLLLECGEEQTLKATVTVKNTYSNTEENHPAFSETYDGRRAVEFGVARF